jgi:hypothetical protein
MKKLPDFHPTFNKTNCMYRFLILLTILLSSFQVFAYPITPCPLRKLVIESKYIIRGKVIKLGEEALKKNDDSWNRDYAIISVSEVWQGRLAEREVKVYFTKGMICPAPGVFYKDEEVLAFIDEQEKGNGYTVHALSYGVKHDLTAAGFQVYKSRVKEMQQIIDLKDAKEKQAQTLEWLVTCAENKATRWEGTYDLSPYSDFMSHYDRDEAMGRKDIYLNSQQRQRIFQAFMQTDTIDYMDLALVDIASEIDDCKMLDKLKKSLLLSDTTDYYRAGSIMHKIAGITGHAELKTISKNMSNAYGWEMKDIAKRKEFFLLFMQKMQEVPCTKMISTSDKSTG